MNDWDKHIGRDVKVFGLGNGKITYAPNFSIFFIEVNNKTYAITQRSVNKDWVFAD
jgi:hypothetical protein